MRKRPSQQPSDEEQPSKVQNVDEASYDPAFNFCRDVCNNGLTFSMAYLRSLTMQSLQKFPNPVVSRFVCDGHTFDVSIQVIGMNMVFILTENGKKITVYENTLDKYVEGLEFIRGECVYKIDAICNERSRRRLAHTS